MEESLAELDRGTLVGNAKRARRLPMSWQPPGFRLCKHCAVVSVAFRPRRVVPEPDAAAVAAFAWSVFAPAVGFVVGDAVPSAVFAGRCNSFWLPVGVPCPVAAAAFDDPGFAWLQACPAAVDTSCRSRRYRC